MIPMGGDIVKAVALLKSGETVAIPTETVYGLAANALDEKAVARIFELKQRPAFDPLIIHLPSAERLKEYVQEIPDAFYKLYESFSPGPISYVLPKKGIIPDLVTAGHPTVAVRFPAHPVAQSLLKELDFPLAAPSANLFGRVSPTQAIHVAEQFQDLAYILEGGKAAIGLESTIVDLSGKKPLVLRLGGLSLEALEASLGEKVAYTKSSSSNPKAPGMLSAHYSPGIPLLHGSLSQNLQKVNRQRCGSISFCRKIAGIADQNQRVLSPTGDLKEAASKLFEAMRSFKAKEIDVILAEEFPNEGLGRAINDRLRRASVSWISLKNLGSFFPQLEILPEVNTAHLFIWG